MMFDMSGLMDDLVVYAGLHPWRFIYYVLFLLSPFFAISAYLANQLADTIDAKLVERRSRFHQLCNGDVTGVCYYK